MYRTRYTDDPIRPVRVLVWPRWFDNPYLPSLLGNLRSRGIQAFSSPSLSLGSLRLQRGDWLHLHWPGETHTHENELLYRLAADGLLRRIRRLKQRGVRIAWTAHNLVPHDDPHPELGHRARADLLELVDHVFIHFPSARGEIAAEFGYRGPTTVVHHPNYIDDYPASPATADARRKLGLPADGFVALAFGRIRPYKGVGDIVRAFQLIAGERDRLIIAGYPEGDVSADMAMASADPRIVVDARKIPRDAVARYFAAADAAVIAHRDFFTSGSALLALSMGCPVIGPDAHHLADLVGGQRMFAAEPSVTGIAEGLSRARDAAPTIDHAAIREWAAAHGSWQQLATDTAAVFRSNRPEVATVVA